MSIDNLRKWLGNAAPSPHDTELRRNVRDAVIEYDALLAAFPEYADPNAKAEREQLRARVKELEADNERMVRGSMRPITFERVELLSRIEGLEIQAAYESETAINAIAERDALGAQLDADRAAWAEARKALEQQVAAATMRESKMFAAAEALIAGAIDAARFIPSSRQDAMEVLSARIKRMRDAMGPRAPEPEATEQRVGLTMHVCDDDVYATRPDCRACGSTGLDELEDVQSDAEVKP